MKNRGILSDEYEPDQKYNIHFLFRYSQNNENRPPGIGQYTDAPLQCKQTIS